MRRHVLVVLAAIWGLGFCCWGADRAPADKRLAGGWSDSMGGMTVRVVVDRAVHHPGEPVTITDEYQQEGNPDVPCTHTLHMITPSGEHMINDLGTLAMGQLMASGGVVKRQQWNIRLVKNAVNWRSAEPKGKVKPVDLSPVGVFTFWVELEATENWLKEQERIAAERGVPAPVGRIASARLTFTSRAVTEAEMKRELTLAQRDDLRIIVEGPDKHDRNDVRLAKERIFGDLKLAENVGLADAATAIVVERAERWSEDVRDLYGALRDRAVDLQYSRQPRVELAIRGEYLRPLAEMELKSLQAGIGSGTGPFTVLLAVCLDSKDEVLRKPLEELAIAHAKAGAKRGDQKPAPEKDLVLAWNLLGDLGTLMGKTEAEVIGILGEPTSRQPNIMLIWESPLTGVEGIQPHVVPFFSVMLDEGGKVKAVNSGRH